MEDDSSERILKLRRRSAAARPAREVEDDSSERILKLAFDHELQPVPIGSGRRFFRENTETVRAVLIAELTVGSGRRFFRENTETSRIRSTTPSDRFEVEDDSSERILKHRCAIPPRQSLWEVEDDSSERILKPTMRNWRSASDWEVEDDSSERILKHSGACRSMPGSVKKWKTILQREYSLVSGNSGTRTMPI